MRAHVFDHTNNWRPKLIEHVYALARVHQGHILRGGDDDCSVHMGFLRQCHVHVSGAGWKIHNQNIQRAPLNLCKHLLQGSHQHWATPNHGLIFIGHKADGHHSDAKVA